MDNLFLFAKLLINQASREILKNYKKVKSISYKKGHFNLVTNVDKEVENFIISKIKNKYPFHSIVAEESGIHKRNKRYEWFIDPIDGTTNFAHSYPCYCISIAFAKDGIVQFGLILNPVTNELYTAIRNKGARLNNKPIKVSDINTLKESLLVTGFSHDKKNSKLNNFSYFKKLTLKTHGVRRDGSAAMDLCYVASGKADGFWEQKLNPWDIAAGWLLVKEAGGKVTAFNGTKYNLYSKQIIATNGKIHNALVKELK